jgi:hypothetical protein
MRITKFVDRRQTADGAGGPTEIFFSSKITFLSIKSSNEPDTSFTQLSDWCDYILGCSTTNIVTKFGSTEIFSNIFFLARNLFFYTLGPWDTLQTIRLIVC